MEQNAYVILGHLAKVPRNQMAKGADISTATGLSPDDVNDAVRLLVDAGHAEWLQYLGTKPFVFGEVAITSRGRYELEKIEDSAKAPTPRAVSSPPTPVGSPYGFEDEDWETVTSRKGDYGELNVVLGMKFESEYYDTEALKANIEASFTTAVETYRRKPGALPMRLAFRPLMAGYGEHLFNRIARDIISADIAVFDTSDLNPNVMLEMGVALTWGVRVLPIKLSGRPEPPSDVSGQTWADYQNSGQTFDDPEHDAKLAAMVERAIRKKAAGADT
ncbi:MAG: hypothetical protein RDV41_15585 [Planctomycetota bacterium]|nr:hypothetical protein [Planctomycetota bacterium]